MDSWNRFRRTLGRFVRSPVALQRFTLEAWWELLVVSVWLRTPLRRHLLEPALRAQALDRRPPVADPLADAVARASACHLKPMTCLERALALQRLLLRRGAPVKLRIGVRREGEALEAHAWLEGAAAPPDALDGDFAPIAGMPAAALWPATR
jgi:hypothetical protein